LEVADEAFKASKDKIGEINDADVKKINLILETESPKTLIKGLEAFVGILRNARVSTPVDTELFFKDHGKLISKLKRMEPTGLRLEFIENHTKALDEVRPDFEKPWEDPKVKATLENPDLN